MLSLKDLEFLSALARHKHFARAADECQVSQPAFSMRIRKIEEKLDTAIVKRGNRFQGFTSEGEALLRHARKVVEDMKVLEQEFRSAKGEVTGKLSLGVVPTAVVFAARAVKSLRVQHPGITVCIQTATSLAIQQGLENGTYDAGITYGEGVSRDLLKVEDVYSETYYLLAPGHLVPKNGEAVTWTEAAQMPLSLLEPDMQNRRILDKVFSDLGLFPEVLVETSGFMAAMVLAAEELTATVVPRMLIETLGRLEGTVALPLIEPTLEKAVSLVTPLREPGLPTVEVLRRILRKS